MIWTYWLMYFYFWIDEWVYSIKMIILWWRYFPIFPDWEWYSTFKMNIYYFLFSYYLVHFILNFIVNLSKFYFSILLCFCINSLKLYCVFCVYVYLLKTLSSSPLHNSSLYFITSYFSLYHIHSLIYSNFHIYSKFSKNYM